jgi:hypothetical protein
MLIVNREFPPDIVSRSKYGWEKLGTSDHFSCRVGMSVDHLFGLGLERESIVKLRLDCHLHISNELKEDRGDLPLAWPR